MSVGENKAVVRRYFEEFSKGNLDAVNEMLNADDATFEQAVKDRLEIGKPGSGYILSSDSFPRRWLRNSPHWEPAPLAE